MSALGKEDPLLEVDSQPFLATSYDDAMKLYKASKPEIVKGLDESTLYLHISSLVSTLFKTKILLNNTS